ncbi:outer membrane protein assembly factor BamE [Ottowia sp.]|uniref:outer membrane protein assembly factor BamE n=1 Tax=Ottowia sp. TaxID=1898956 RepID=UPI002CEFE75B|nr:outer membrane protein assembly factor BamE [Ottowia sp.]HOB65795.1 outer membrane protein assembly factor BamE [Ottowia sp.]HPZ56636.1 outer membrane protein assembly factor BamE [Ottowia sp.]HQD47101.1 outer membrane protein assembly factor BamE [Ottowia sp.]
MSVTLRTHVRTTALVLPAVLAAALGGCSSFDRGTRGIADALTLYRPEVVQGNFVSKEQVAALQPGMTRLQVRDLLGTPLVTSVFHQNRWDYVFTMKRQGVEPQRYRLTAYFEGDTLARFDGDDMPSEAEFVQRISRERKVKVPPLQATEDQLAKFPVTSAADAPADSASASSGGAQPALRYPPLEPGR